MMKGYSFCPNCFQTGTYNGYTCKACGYIQEQKDKYALSPGTRLKERYLLGRVLGVGGFGITYLAFDPASGRMCALKEYFPRAWAVRDNATNSLMPTTEGQQEVYRHGRDVFINEAKILQGLYANPHVVNVLDFFYDNETAYMVMEYIQGQTINDYMKKKKHTVSIRMANQMLREIGEALEQIHQNMLLHRDISPDNIMITPNGQFKLIDFGATRTYALSNPLSMSIFVKPGFAPIEQYSRTGHQGPWTDIYALCATYYYMVTGEKPPSAPDRQNGIRLTPLAPHNPSQGTILLSAPRPPCGFRLSRAQLHDFLFHQIQGKSQNEYPHWLQILLLLFLRHWRSPAVPNFRPLLPPAGSTGLTTTAVWAVDIEIFPVPVTKSFPSSLPSLLYAVRSIRLINALSSFFSKF